MGAPRGAASCTLGAERLGEGKAFPPDLSHPPTPAHKDNRTPSSPRDPVTQARRPPFWATLTKASVPAGWPRLGAGLDGLSVAGRRSTPLLGARGGPASPSQASDLGELGPSPELRACPRSGWPASLSPPISARRGLASLLDPASGVKSRHERAERQAPASEAGLPGALSSPGPAGTGSQAAWSPQVLLPFPGSLPGCSPSPNSLLSLTVAFQTTISESIKRNIKSPIG